MAISTKQRDPVEVCVMNRAALVVDPKARAPRHVAAGVALKTHEHISERDAMRLVLHDIATDYTGKRLPKGAKFPGGEKSAPAPAGGGEG